MRNICFVTSGSLPVPAVKGGAVEQLVQQLCEDNERDPRFNITCITKANLIAENLQKMYVYTRFVNIHTWGNFYYRMAWKARGLMRRLTNYDYPRFHIYEWRTHNYLMHHAHNFDLIIAEACDIQLLDAFARKKGTKHICLHLHGPFQACLAYDKIYGSLLAVSEFIKQNYSATSSVMNKDNALVLMNGIDTNRFCTELTVYERHQLREKLDFSDDDFVIIFCGRIIKEKGVKQLIEAVISISEPNVKLLIVGSSNFGKGNEGEYPKEVQRLSQQNLARIKYTGYVQNSEMYRYYKVADIGIVPSMCNDSCPLTIFEMMASGLPTVATKVGGIPEIGTDETTLFIENDSCIVDSIKNSILKFYKNSDLQRQFSLAALKRAKLFSREIYFNTFCEHVNKLITHADK